MRRPTLLVADLDADAEANGAGPRPDDPDDLAEWLAFGRDLPFVHR